MSHYSPPQIETATIDEKLEGTYWRQRKTHANAAEQPQDSLLSLGEALDLICPSEGFYAPYE